MHLSNMDYFDHPVAQNKPETRLYWTRTRALARLTMRLVVDA
jgi:hypothetical protein